MPEDHNLRQTCYSCRSVSAAGWRRALARRARRTTVPPPRRRCRRASPSFRLATGGLIAAAAAFNAATAAAGRRRTASNRQVHYPPKAPAHLTSMVPMTMRRLSRKAGTTLLAVIATRMSMATMIDCNCELMCALLSLWPTYCQLQTDCLAGAQIEVRVGSTHAACKCCMQMPHANAVQIQLYGCELATPPYLLTDHEGHEMSTNHVHACD